MAAARRPPDRPGLIYDPPEPRRDRAQPGRKGAGLERMPECEVHVISDIAIGMLPPKEIATGRNWSFMTFPDRARGIIVDAIGRKDLFRFRHPIFCHQAQHIGSEDRRHKTSQHLALDRPAQTLSRRLLN